MFLDVLKMFGRLVNYCWLVAKKIRRKTGGDFDHRNFTHADVHQYSEVREWLLGMYAALQTS